MTLVGKKAPCFKATAVMPDGSFKEVSLEDYKGKYVLFFFYPLDFTFVCPSEIVAFDKTMKEFNARGVQVLGCSVDSQFSHFAWRETPLEKGGIGRVQFPLVADLSKKISSDYGVLHDGGMSFRGLFIMNKDHIIQHALVNDLPIGRSVEEALRIVDAMQFHEANGDVCPANWKKGEKAMKASQDGVAKYLAGMK